MQHVGLKAVRQNNTLRSINLN